MRLIFNIISFATFALAVFFLITRGLHLSVEFTGGTLMEVNYTQAADVGKIRDTVAGLGFTDVQVQNFGTSRDVHDPPARPEGREHRPAKRARCWAP